MPTPKNFCPWCGKALPEDVDCSKMCQHTLPRQLTGEQLFWVFQSYAGLVFFSVIGFAIGGFLGGLIAGHWGSTFGSSIGLFVPAMIFTLVISRKFR